MTDRHCDRVRHDWSTYLLSVILLSYTWYWKMSCQNSIGCDDMVVLTVTDTRKLWSRWPPSCFRSYSCVTLWLCWLWLIQGSFGLVGHRPASEATVVWRCGCADCDRYKEALVSLATDLLQKLQFRYNQSQLEELDDDVPDDDVCWFVALWCCITCKTSSINVVCMKGWSEWGYSKCRQTSQEEFKQNV